MPATDVKNTVHGLWVQGALSPIEELTIRSFLRQGYSFVLWTYNREPYSVPPGAICKDANEILDRSAVFSYQRKNQFGHGQGSFAGFSDIFRYRLLYLYGGWWTDMDITCLRRLPSGTPYIFRTVKDQRQAVGNIMFCPQGSELMQWCYETARQVIHPGNTDWLRPLQILNEGIQRFGLTAYLSSFTNADSWPLVTQYMTRSPSTGDIAAFHWMNEEFRRIGLSKHSFIENSFLQQQMATHGIEHDILRGKDAALYRLKTSLPYYIAINLKHLPSLLYHK